MPTPDRASHESGWASAKLAIWVLRHLLWCPTLPIARYSTRSKHLQGEHDLIFVDLEGVAGLMASYAASSADLCLVPMRPSALDGDAAGAALRMIRDAGRAARRMVPARILLTQTDAAIITTSYREVIAELDTAGVPRLRTELVRRAPYERVMAEGRTLFELAPSPSVTSAISNVAHLGKELADILEGE